MRVTLLRNRAYDNNSRIGEKLMNVGIMKNYKTFIDNGLYIATRAPHTKARGRIRTDNPLFTKQELYH